VNDAIPKIEDNPKAALESFIRELEEYYYPWYDSATTRNFYAWSIAQALALVSGFATSILAVLLQNERFKSWGTGQVLLVLLPIVGSLASTFLIQSRIAELEALRERGRETIQRLANEARVEFAAASLPEQFSEIHRKLVSDVSTLEQEQSRTFQRIIPKALSFRSSKNARSAK
jgi:hypothetical protein